MGYVITFFPRSDFQRGSLVTFVFTFHPYTQQQTAGNVQRGSRRTASEASRRSSSSRGKEAESGEPQSRCKSSILRQWDSALVISADMRRMDPPSAQRQTRSR